MIGFDPSIVSLQGGSSDPFGCFGKLSSRRVKEVEKGRREVVVVVGGGAIAEKELISRLSRCSVRVGCCVSLIVVDME